MGNLQDLKWFCDEQGIDLFAGCSVPAPLDLNHVINQIMLRCGLLTPVYSEPQVFKMMTRMWFDTNQWTFDHLVKMILAEYEPHENVFEAEGRSTTHSGIDTLTHGEVHTLGGQDTFQHGEKHTLGGQDTFQHGETHTLGGQDTLGHGETHTLSGSDTLGHGETHTLSGSDTLGHGETHTLSGTDTDTDTTSNTHEVSAYNSSGYQADSKDTKGGSVSTQYGKTDTASGTDTTTYGKKDTASGTDTTTYGKKDTASGTDTTTYGKTDTASGTDTTGYGKTDTASGDDKTTYGHKIVEAHNRHGNVGVKSSSDLMQEELNLLERFNVYDWIAAKFERENMIQCY